MASLLATLAILANPTTWTPPYLQPYLPFRIWGFTTTLFIILGILTILIPQIHNTPLYESLEGIFARVVTQTCKVSCKIFCQVFYKILCKVLCTILCGKGSLAKPIPIPILSWILPGFTVGKLLVLLAGWVAVPLVVEGLFRVYISIFVAYLLSWTVGVSLQTLGEWLTAAWFVGGAVWLAVDAVRWVYKQAKKSRDEARRAGRRWKWWRRRDRRDPADVDDMLRELRREVDEFIVKGGR